MTYGEEAAADATEKKAQKEAAALSDYLNAKAEQFESLCRERHEAGEKEYGSLTFLGNDVVRMMLEELADTANYCRMQAIKLLMLQEHLEAELATNDGLIQGTDLGFNSFQGVKDIGWGKK